MIQTLRVAALALLLLGAAACTSVDLGAAKSLTASGIQAATASQEEIKAAQKALVRAPEHSDIIRCFTRALNKAVKEDEICPVKIENPTAVEDIARIVELLEAQHAMVSSLADLYQGMSALIDYDATSEVKAAVGDFTGSINAIATATGSDTQFIPDALTGALGSTFGLIAEEKKKQALLEVNKIVLGGLRFVLPVLEKTKSGRALGLKNAVVQTLTVQQVWINTGLGSAQDEMRTLVGNSGGNVVKDADGVLGKNPRLKVAFEGVRGRMFLRDASVPEKSVEANLNLLKKLIAEHEKLERDAGEAIDVKGMLELADKLLAIAEEWKQVLKWMNEPKAQIKQAQ